MTLKEAFGNKLISLVKNRKYSAFVVVLSNPYLEILLNTYNKHTKELIDEYTFEWLQSQFNVLNEEPFKEVINALDYKYFLTTNYWKLIKEEKLKRINKCQLCNSNISLHVHHNTYDHHGEEHKYIDTDLTVLCKSCHFKHHKRF